jgi:hypothetical protein
MNMSKFDNVAINKQLSSTSIAEANHHFAITCDICCHNPRCNWKDCNHCVVREYHEQVVAALSGKEVK